MADASVPPAVYTEGKEVASPGSLEKTEEQHPTFTPSSQSVKLEANTHSMPVTQGGVQREGVEAPGDTSDAICPGNSHPAGLPDLQDLTGQEDTLDASQLSLHRASRQSSGSSQDIKNICKLCGLPCSPHYLKCHVCEKRIHFACSNLPPYQIMNLSGTHRNRRYTCQPCTAPVSCEILEALDRCDSHPIKQVKQTQVYASCQTEQAARNHSSCQREQADHSSTDCQTEETGSNSADCQAREVDSNHTGLHTQQRDYNHTGCQTDQGGYNHTGCQTDQRGYNHTGCQTEQRGYNHTGCQTDQRGYNHTGCQTEQRGYNHFSCQTEREGNNHTACQTEQIGNNHTGCQTEQASNIHASCQTGQITHSHATCQTEHAMCNSGNQVNSCLYDPHQLDSLFHNSFSQMENTLRKMVQGLCEDVNNSRIESMSASLKASRAEVQTLQCKQETSKRKIKEQEEQIRSRVDKQECTCNTKLQEAATRSLELESKITDLETTITKLTAEQQSTQKELITKEKNIEARQDKIREHEATIDKLEKQLTKEKSENVAANELSRELERQLQDDDKTPWSSVPLKKVKVKGPDNPLSNFFPSKLKAFNSTFDTLEHAYQYKKLFDHDLFEEAESIRHIESPYDVKTEARKHIGDSKTKIWEECSERTMCSLLAKKRDVCPEFSEALKNTKGKEILHNVASPVWGTGLDGSGENRFGKILMRLRDEWFQSTSEETGATAGQTGKGTKTKPEVIIIGNSLLGGIKPDKLSKDFNTSIRQAYTIAEAKQTVANLEANPSVIVFQLVTNDVKDREATSVTEDYMNLIATTKDRKPEAHVIISQAPYQDNASTQSVRTALVNASIQSAYHESDIICTDNRIISGFANDKVHLNHSGTSMLARNIKASVLHTLGITTSDHVRNNNEHPLPTP